MMRRRVRIKPGLWFLAAAGALAVAGAPRASTAQVPPPPSISPLTFEILTEYRTPQGEQVGRVTPGVLLAPIPVDVDGDIATGTAGAEVLAQLTIDAGRATLRVTKLPLAPDRLPLRIEAVLTDPRGADSTLRVAFGYDALTDTAPAVYSATVQLVGAQRVTSFALDIETVGAGATLGVIAEVFDEGPGGARVDPQRGRIDYTPVPRASHFGLLQGRDFGTQQSGVDLVTDTPTKVVIVIEDVQGNRVVRGDLTIDRVPHLVSLLLTESDDGRKTWNYQATEVIDLIDLVIREKAGGNVVDDFVLHLEQMALNVVLVQDTPTHATMQADRPIGLVRAGAADGRAVAFLDDDAYLYSTDANSADSFAFQVRGLRRVELDSGDPFIVDVTLQAGPFRVLIEDGPRTIDAAINDLPSNIHLELSTSAGTVEWTGSDPVGLIRVVATDPGGIAGRATRLELELREVPRVVSFAFGANGGAASLDAHDARIASVDLLLTSGPRIAVDDGFDGVVLEDVASHYALAARLTGLRLVSVSTGDPPYTLTLRKNAGPFLVDLQQGSRDTRIEIHDLPDSLTATFDPAGSLSYTASARMDLITAHIADPEGISGRATRLDVRIEDIPAELTLGFVAGQNASVDANGERIGLVSLLLTSGPVIEVDFGFDGVVMEDLSSHYAVAVRLRGLRLVQVTTGAPPYQMSLRKDAGPFLVSLREGARTTRIEVLDLPSSLDATLDPDGAVAYSGSAPIGRITAAIDDPAGVADRATSLRLTLQTLPAALDLAWTSQGTAVVDAKGAEIGLITLLATSGPQIELPAGFDGVVLEDVPSHYAVAARLTGLRVLRAATEAPYTLTLQKAAGPFLIDLTQQDATTRIEIVDLPSSLEASLDPDAGTLAYTASAGIGSITARIADPEGVAGRATRLELDAAALPAALDLSFASGANAGIDAHGAQIGSLRLLLTSGPDREVDAGFDGLVLEDLDDRFVLAARLTGLKLVTVTTGVAPYTLALQKAPGPFLVDLRQGARTTRVEVLDLPSSLNATFDPAGSLSYSASAGIGAIVARLSDPAGISGRATLATAVLRSLPDALDLSWTGGGGAVVADAKGKTIGSIEVLLTSGPSFALPADRDGVVLHDLPGEYLMYGRITGLRYASFAQGPPPSLRLDTSGGRIFVVDLQTAKPGGVATTTATIDSLPSSVTIRFASATQIEYRASSAVSSIVLDAYDPAGISGRAPFLNATIQSLPVALDIVWSSGGTIRLDAFGGTVGLIEVQLTSGPDERLPAQYDGFLLNDTADRYVVFARLTGLRKVVATQGQAPDILVETTGGRVLRAEITEWNGSKQTFTRATLDRLPSSARFRISDAGGKQEIFYNASAPTNSLLFETNAGDRWSLSASLAGPLPASVYFCQAGNNACGGSGRGANAGSATFTASEHTTVNLLDCVRPLNAGCPGSPDDYIRVSSLRVRRMTFDADADDVGESGHIFLDTDWHELTGNIKIIDGSSGFEAQFNGGFRSDNRLGRWSFWGLDKDKSGSIVCNGSLDIRVFGIWIGVTSYLC